MDIEKEYSQETQQLYNLMVKIREDSHLGLQEFYAVYGSFLYAIANIYKGPLITPNEIIQEVFKKMWRTSKNPRYIEKPKSWLYVITANSAKDLFRSRKSVHSRLNEETVAATDDMENFIELDSFNYMIRDLSLKEQQVIIQKLLVGKTFEEIAKDMHSPIGSISSMYYRAIDKLKEDLEKN